MEKIPDELNESLYIAPVLVFLALAVVGMFFYGIAEIFLPAREMYPHLLLVMICYLLALVGWRVQAWNLMAARWLSVAGACLVAFLTVLWLQFPGALVLVSIAPALAIAQLGIGAGIGAAALESLILVVLVRFAAVDLPTGAVGLLQIWGLLGVVAAIYHPAHSVAAWSWSYFTNARQLLKEARNRQSELARALDDLAHANQQLTRLNILAQSLRQAAEDARIAKVQFVTNVSHELRTPLNMITGFSEIMLDTSDAYGQELPAALLADLTIIRRNAGHLSDLIDDVLDLSQIEAGQMALMREYASLPELIQAASEAVRPLFNSKHLYLNVEIEEPLPPIFCDRTRIREVLLNLLSNAGRFTEHGGVTIRAGGSPESVTVAVSDTGPGIQSDQLGKLFQPFQQLDNSIRRRYGGTGLGLNISMRFIEMHDGKIWVESQPGVGTTFSFQLPLAPAAPVERTFTRWMVPEWDLVHREPASRPLHQKVRPRLVVAESGSALKRLLQRYFGDVEVVSVENVEQAVREIDEAPSQLLVVNQQTENPQGTGIEPTDLPDGVPVVSCWLPGATDMASRLGAVEYLVKPISKTVLLETLDRIPMENHTVLIVDDEPEALRLFQRMLHSSGKNYHVLRARNGQEALRVMSQYRPDVILMDLVMPNMDGFQLLRHREEDPVLKTIPVIIISARDSSGHPIVTPSITITRKGGISVHALMECIQAVTRILAHPGQPDDPGSREASPGELVS